MAQTGKVKEMSDMLRYLHQSLIEVPELSDLIVHLLTKPTRKMAEDKRLSVSLLVVVVNVRHIEVLLGNDDSVLVVVSQILQTCAHKGHKGSHKHRSVFQHASGHPSMQLQGHTVVLAEIK